jgi:hypothetical protein
MTVRTKVILFAFYLLTYRSSFYSHVPYNNILSVREGVDNGGAIIVYF